MLKRNKDYKKVFNNINSQLGANALEEVYEKFEGAYEEQQELSKLIETQIRDISLAEVQLQENKRYVDFFITEETRQAVLHYPELHSSLSVRERTGKFHINEEYEDTKKETVLVKKRKY